MVTEEDEQAKEEIPDCRSAYKLSD
jgi:hypothetical protein